MKKIFSSKFSEKTGSNRDTTRELKNEAKNQKWREDLHNKDQEDRLANIMQEYNRAIRWLEKSKTHLAEIGVNGDKLKLQKLQTEAAHIGVTVGHEMGGKNGGSAEKYILQAKTILEWRDRLRLKSVDISRFENDIPGGIEAVKKRYDEAFNYVMQGGNIRYSKKDVMTIVSDLSEITMTMSKIKRDPTMDNLLKFNEQSKGMLEIQLQVQKEKHELPNPTLDYD